jgi:hypothetical protein
VALGAAGFFFAVDEGFEVVVAFFADVFEDGHENSDASVVLVSLTGKRDESKARDDGSTVLTGRGIRFVAFPALKRRAIVGRAYSAR